MAPLGQKRPAVARVARDAKHVERALEEAARLHKSWKSADAALTRAKAKVKSAKEAAREAERIVKVAEKAQLREQAARDKAVRAAHAAGALEAEIAKRMGLTVQKVRSINSVGAAARKKPRARAKAA